jgi:hypothetical protein
MSRARRGQARSGVCRVCPPPVRTPRPRRRGAPPQARGKKPRQRPHTPHTRTRGTRAGAPVSREGTLTLPVTAHTTPSSPVLVASRQSRSRAYSESLLMNWVVLRHSMTPTCCHRPPLVEAGRRDPSTPPRCIPAPPATRSVQSLTADSEAGVGQSRQRRQSAGCSAKLFAWAFSRRVCQNSRQSRRLWRVADCPAPHGLASLSRTCLFPFSPCCGT